MRVIQIFHRHRRTAGAHFGAAYRKLFAVSRNHSPHKHPPQSKSGVYLHGTDPVDEGLLEQFRSSQDIGASEQR